MHSSPKYVVFLESTDSDKSDLLFYAQEVIRCIKSYLNPVQCR
nr:MAG TPA: hypothetical protein [Caudoviricetes sp.]